MKLYIAEKPSLARTIAKSLGAMKKKHGYIEGDNCIVTWCFGHLYELNKPDDYESRYLKWDADDLPIIPEEFGYKPKEDAIEQIETINHLVSKLKNNDIVINCGDPDREGQLLVDQAIEFSGFKGIVMRAWLKDLTSKGLSKTLLNLDNNMDYEGLKNAALARSKADWLIGINMTRAYSCRARHFGHQGVLTIGRVQTPTLNMVVQRCKQIENFVERTFYEYEFQLAKDENEFVATQITEKVFDKTHADSLLKSDTAVVVSYEAVEKKKNPALPFTLSQLQSACNKEFGLSAQETQDVAQSLYEVHKLISYPRTDCPYLSEGEFDDNREVWEGLIKQFDVGSLMMAKDKKPSCFNDKKVGAHTGIIPVSLDAKDLSEMETNVFELIKQNYVCQFLKPMRFNHVVAEFKCGEVKLKSTGKQVVDNGFMGLTHKSKSIFEGSVLPPQMKTGDQLQVLSYELKSKTTSPPKMYTEGTLIKAMENVANHLEQGNSRKLLREVGGIGTEATRAGIIDSLKTRGFLETKKKNIVATTKAEKFMSLIADDLKSPILTAQWEQKLKEIESNDLKVNEYLNSLSKWVDANCEEALKADMSIIGGTVCPSCHQGYLVVKRSKNGPFTGCSNYPDCKFIVNSSSKKKRTKKRKKTRRAV